MANLKTKDKKNTVPINSTTIILESISDGVFTVDKNWRITSFNRAAETITGVSRDDAIGRYCSEVFRASMCEMDCALKKTLKTGSPVINQSAFLINSEGRKIPISVSTALLHDEDETILGGAETFRDLSLVEDLRKELRGRYQTGDLVSKSSSMRNIFDMLHLLAASLSTVLIQGETGTGKEVIAKAIHNQSERKDKPFIAVNCGALPDTLLESELFGYKAGAFTGANKDKPGRFELAKGGTLFLDEIGEISSALQIRLLRVLQEKTFEMLGDIKTIKTDARIIAATNQDLSAKVKEGSFRQDLFYRINVVRVDLPPLSKRKEDIPLLIDQFVSRFNKIQNKSVKGVSREVTALLMAYNYPGNIRELENIIEYAFVLCSEEFIESHHLPEEFKLEMPISEAHGNINLTLKTLEVQTIKDALKRNQYNRLLTARELGIHKSTLFRKIKALGISLPKQDGRYKK